MDTLLRTAYELQDGLSRSAQHARKPLPSAEQARPAPPGAAGLSVLRSLALAW